MEIHVHYLNEVSLDDELELHLQLLDYDHKRLHYFQQMYHKEQGYLAATSEQLALHVDLQTRRSGAFPQHVIDKLDTMANTHLRLDARPSWSSHRYQTQIERYKPIGHKKGGQAAFSTWA